MNRLARWSIVPLALAALAAGFVATRPAAAEVPVLASYYEGKVLYKSVHLGEPVEKDRGALPCRVFVSQEGNFMSASIQVDTPEGLLVFDLQGVAGNGRFWLARESEGNFIVLDGTVGGREGKRTMRAGGSLIEGLDLSDVRLAVREAAPE